MNIENKSSSESTESNRLNIELLEPFDREAKRIRFSETCHESFTHEKSPPLVRHEQIHCASSLRDGITLPASPFLDSHLTMLKSLYNANENLPCNSRRGCNQRVENENRKVEESAVHDELWEKIVLFLKKKRILYKTQHDVAQLNRIKKEATYIMQKSSSLLMDEFFGMPKSAQSSLRETKECNDGSNILKMDKRKSRTISFINEHQAQNSYQYSSRASRFLPFTKFMRRDRTSVNSFVPSKIRISSHQITTEPSPPKSVYSLALVMRFLGKRSEAAEFKRIREMEPFRPLVKAIEIRLRELQVALNLLYKCAPEKRTHQKCVHIREHGFMLQRRGWISKFCDESSAVKISEILSKMQLWQMLISDLQLSFTVKT